VTSDVPDPVTAVAVGAAADPVKFAGTVFAGSGEIAASGMGLALITFPAKH
jgi:hypothetical protein